MKGLRGASATWGLGASCGGVGAVGMSVVAALLTAACSHGGPPSTTPMQAPSAYAQIEVSADAAEPQATRIGSTGLDMLYATDRAPAAHGSVEAYSGERGYLLRVGAARIETGASDLTWEAARKVSLLKNQPDTFPLRIGGTDEYGILPDSVSIFTPRDLAAQADANASARFVRAVDARLERSPVKDIYLYVHGYKVAFDNPLLVASELWHFLGYEGAFVAFSWPSTPARLAYMKDIETARVSAQALRILIEYLARETRASRIHILGYSAGTRVVLTALYELALIHQRSPDADIRRTTKLGNVLLVGSDIDSGLFASYLLDGLGRVPEHLTFYTSPSDQALHLSNRIFAHRRMGEILPGTLDARMRDYLATSSRLSLVDVEGAANFDAGNGHAYFRNSPWVSSDVLMTLRYGLPPAARGLVRDETSPIWRFPADYVTRFEAARLKARVGVGAASETARSTGEDDAS